MRSLPRCRDWRPRGQINSVQFDEAEQVERGRPGRCGLLGIESGRSLCERGEKDSTARTGQVPGNYGDWFPWWNSVQTQPVPKQTTQ